MTNDPRQQLVDLDTYSPLPQQGDGLVLWTMNNPGVDRVIWRPLEAFGSGWASYGGGFEGAGYTVDSSGLIHLRGLVTKTTGLPIAGETIGTIPAALAPGLQNIFEQTQGTVGAGSSAYRIDITTAGGILWTGQGASGPLAETDFTSLAGINWMPAIPAFTWHPSGSANQRRAGWAITSQTPKGEAGFGGTRVIYPGGGFPAKAGFTRQYRFAFSANTSQVTPSVSVTLKPSANLFGTSLQATAAIATATTETIADSGWISEVSDYNVSFLLGDGITLVTNSGLAAGDANAIFITHAALYGRYI